MEDKKKITIVTHDSNFHTDDIFAVATLLMVLGDEVNAEVIRSRDKDIIEKADYVVDVGTIYDPEKNRFDHHQEGRAGERPNTIPYASFGLVWKKYGEMLSGSVEVAQKIDEVLVQWIDATDNGIQIIETKVPGIYPYDIGLFFNTFNPTWKESQVSIDDLFMQALPLAKMILGREIKKRKDLIEVRDIVENIYKGSEDKRLIVFDKYYPSSEFLAKFPEPLFTVFPKDNGNWNLKAVKEDINTFACRKYLPRSWAGKRDEELEEVTGVSGSVFCHNGCFIAVAKTKEAILKLAEIALNS